MKQPYQRGKGKNQHKTPEGECGGVRILEYQHTPRKFILSEHGTKFLCESRLSLWSSLLSACAPNGVYDFSFIAHLITIK